MYIRCKGGRGQAHGSMTKHVFVLERKAYLGFYVGECPMFQEYW